MPRTLHTGPRNRDLRDATGRKMHDPALKAAFGLDRRANWPDEGMPNRYIGNVQVWVQPKGEPLRRFKHRAMAVCPYCYRVTTAGKLHQHIFACNGMD
jgi:hypothetical protein